MALSRESLIEFLSDKGGVEPSEIGDDTELFTSGLLDSFTMVDVIMFVEQETGVKIAPRDVHIDNLDSVNRIMALVGKKTSESA